MSPCHPCSFVSLTSNYWCCCKHIGGGVMKHSSLKRVCQEISYHVPEMHCLKKMLVRAGVSTI